VPTPESLVRQLRAAPDGTSAACVRDSLSEGDLVSITEVRFAAGAGSATDLANLYDWRRQWASSLGVTWHRSAVMAIDELGRLGKPVRIGLAKVGGLNICLYVDDEGHVVAAYLGVVERASAAMPDE
jgi:hypothetical protein